MLRGAKPLAVFRDVQGRFPAAVLRYLRVFDRYVDKGVFVKCEYVEFRGKPPMPLQTILYATPSEAWRIDAMRGLLQQGGPWTAERERAEGELLGYSDWQNDIWINRRFTKPVPTWLAFLVRTVSPRLRMPRGS